MKNKFFKCLMLAIMAISLAVVGTGCASTEAGTKDITIIVDVTLANVTETINYVDGIKTLKVKTDALYLLDVMDELVLSSRLSYTGTDSEFGKFINTIDLVTPDYSVDSSFWAVLSTDTEIAVINNFPGGKYMLHGTEIGATTMGVSQVPVKNGQTYVLYYAK